MSRSRSLTKWQRGEPEPALFVPPPGAVRLDEAHAAIEQWEYYSRKPLDPAQKLAVELMLAERADGRWAAMTTARAESRQNGKGDEIEVVEAWGLTQRGEAIVHTAHEIPTAKSAHARLVAHLEGHRDLRKLVKSVRYANGDQAIIMRNGGVIVYRTRTAGGARGLDDISRLVVDEAQHAHPEQLASAMPILAANPNPQVNFIGSAGIAGRSDWWWSMRKRALAGGGEGFAYVEHSAERVELVDGKVISHRPDPFDRENWRRANPAYPNRIADEFLAEELSVLGPELFAREHLCVWDPIDAEAEAVIPEETWRERAATDVQHGPKLVFAVSVAADRSWSCIAAASVLDDGRRLVEVLNDGEAWDYRPSTGWVAARARELVARHAPAAVAISESARSLIPDLEDAGLVPCPLSKAAEVEGTPLVLIGPTDMRAACAGLYDDVCSDQPRLVHVDQPLLNVAVSSAGQRWSGTGWVWDARRGDITPLEAVTIARHVAAALPQPEPAPDWTYIDVWADD